MGTFFDWLDGELVAADDLNSQNARSRELAGLSMEAIFGLRSLLPATGTDNSTLPLSCAAGSGMLLTVGGTGQYALLEGAWTDYCPPTNVTIAPNPGTLQRNDLLCLQPTLIQVNVFDRDVESITGVVTLASCFQFADGFTIEVAQGTPGGGDPLAPAGFVPTYRARVPGGASGLTNAQIDTLLVTATEALQGLTGLDRQGSVTGVPADGAATRHITFSPPFLVAISSISMGVDSGAAAPNAALSSPVFFNVTLTGCDVYLTGGLPSSTAKVWFRASGS